jgi:hypothetical protein
MMESPNANRPLEQSRPTAVKIWTNKEFAQTKKDCKANGFKITNDGFITTIKHGENVVLTAFKKSPQMVIVTITKAYFEPEE